MVRSSKLRTSKRTHAWMHKTAEEHAQRTGIADAKRRQYAKQDRRMLANRVGRWILLTRGKAQIRQAARAAKPDGLFQYEEKLPAWCCLRRWSSGYEAMFVLAPHETTWIDPDLDIDQFEFGQALDLECFGFFFIPFRGWCILEEQLFGDGTSTDTVFSKLVPYLKRIEERLCQRP